MIATRIGLACAGLCTVFLFLVLLAGCSNDTPVIANVFIASTLGPNPGDPNGQVKCGLGAELQWVNIGTSNSSVQDSDSFNGASVSAKCSVSQSQSHTYSVTLTTALSGQGSVSVLNATLNDNLTALQMNVNALFERGDTGNYRTNDGSCTFDYNGQAGGVSDNRMGIGPGKVWGNLTCPNMQLDSDPSKFCEGRAELKFQNCSQ